MEIVDYAVFLYANFRRPHPQFELNILPIASNFGNLGPLSLPAAILLLRPYPVPLVACELLHLGHDGFDL
jgi:hypothetical protein